jgi:hypothetical protein
VVGWRLSCLKPRHDVLAPAAFARALVGCNGRGLLGCLASWRDRLEQAGVDLRYDTTRANVIARPQPVTRPSPSPSSRSFWRLASGVWLGAGPVASVFATALPLAAGCRLLGTCPAQHQCSHVLRTDASDSLRPPQGRRGSLGNALRSSVSLSRSLANQRSQSPPPPVPPNMRSSGQPVNGRLARPHVTRRLAIDYVVEQQPSHRPRGAGCRKNAIGS